MEAFLDRPKSAIQRLLNANTNFKNRLRSATPSHELPKSCLDALGRLSDQLPTRIAALSQSLFLIEQTGLDVVDMETRMQNESGELADLLSEIGDTVRAQFFINKYLEDQLVALDEEANLLAAGLFPSGVQGLNKVNSKLWEFTNLQMIIYRDTLKRVRQGLSVAQCKSIESTFGELRSPFDSLNDLLNRLAMRELDQDMMEARLVEVQRALSAARTQAKSAQKLPQFSEFRTILRATDEIAGNLQELLKSLRIPVFPPYSDLLELRDCIQEPLYSSLTGLQSFALMNITSAMKAIVVGGKSILSPEFKIRVFSVMLDRIYFQANESLLDTVRKSGFFVSASASLHKFRAGSYKQNTFGRGNLQLSYSAAKNGIVNVDADIDLYRDPLVHLFGEVLHNHLTGKKTDAYKVRSILDEQNIPRLDGFRIQTA